MEKDPRFTAPTARERREHRSKKSGSGIRPLRRMPLLPFRRENAPGEKQKRLREKAAQNNQISEKTSLLVKKTLKNLYNSKKVVILHAELVRNEKANGNMACDGGGDVGSRSCGGAAPSSP